MANSSTSHADPPDVVTEPATTQGPAAATGVDSVPPARPTPARLRTFFLQQFARSGSLTDASARTGIATRTVQRWRRINPSFAQRYQAVLDARVEMLEDVAVRRALSAEPRPVFHRGKQVATVERNNDAMLMRVLARFDRLREHQARATASPVARAAEPDDIDLLDAALALDDRLTAAEGPRPEDRRTVDVSPFMRHRNAPLGGR